MISGFGPLRLPKAREADLEVAWHLTIAPLLVQSWIRCSFCRSTRSACSAVQIESALFRLVWLDRPSSVLGGCPLPSLAESPPMSTAAAEMSSSSRACFTSFEIEISSVSVVFYPTVTILERPTRLLRSCIRVSSLHVQSRHWIYCWHARCTQPPYPTG